MTDQQQVARAQVCVRLRLCKSVECDAHINNQRSRFGRHMHAVISNRSSFCGPHLAIVISCKHVTNCRLDIQLDMLAGSSIRNDRLRS